jgi:hypothetical protein
MALAWPQRMIKWFTSMDTAIEPFIAHEQKLQLTRNLRRLSNDLANLQADKLDFADSLARKAGSVTDYNWEDTMRVRVQMIRRSLARFNNMLPPGYQADGTTLLNALGADLNEKLSYLTSRPDNERKDAEIKVRKAAELVGKAKDKVDGFVANIESKK